MGYSCQSDDLVDTNKPIEEKSVLVSFQMPIPSSPIGLTRTIDPTEVIHKTPKFLLFDNEDKFLEIAPVTKRTDNYIIRFMGDIAKKVAKIAVVVNDKADDNHKPSPGDDYESVLKRYKFNGPIAVEEGLPMYGEVEFSMDRDLGKTLQIPLTRAVAAIQLNMNVDSKDFKLQEAWLYSFNESGYVANTVDIDPLSFKRSESLALDVVNGAIKGEIYIPEVDMSKVDENHRPTALILSGLYKGKTYYYRIDFFADKLLNDAPKEVIIDKRISILRNYRYQFNVTAVHGEGFDSREVAENNEASGEMAYDLLTWNEGITEMWEHNGFYFAMPSREITFSAFTNEDNPERISCQSNIPASMFEFTSKNEEFNVKITREPATDITHFDFYPTEAYKKNREKRSNGVISIKNYKYDYAVQFKQIDSYLKVNEIDLDLFGKYVVDHEVNSETDYIKLKVNYVSTKTIRFNVKAHAETVSGKSSSLGFEGVMEFDKDKSEATFILKAFGTPSEPGHHTYSLDFGSLHTKSPIGKLTMSFSVVKSETLRQAKILFVTPNGGDYTSMFSLMNIKELFGPKGKLIDMEDGISVAYASKFPIENALDYHVIYYFDSANKRAFYDTDKEYEKDFKEFLNNASDYVHNDGVMIYCSDDRDWRYGFSIWHPLSGRHEKVSDDVKDRTNHFIKKLGERGLFGLADYAQVQSNNFKDDGLYNRKSDNGYLYPLASTPAIIDREVLVYDHKVTTSGFLRIFNVDLFMKESPFIGLDKYYPICLTGKEKGIGWIGSHRIFLNLDYDADRYNKITPQINQFGKYMKWAIEYADKNHKNYNRPNKNLFFDLDENGKYVVNFNYFQDTL